MIHNRNFPLFVMARKIAPALLAGCTVVVKTSELTPLSTFQLMGFLSAAIQAGKLDLPPGVISVVTGYGPVIGEALCTSPVPGIISMTGSVATGQAIMRNAAANLTKVNLELGGKAPCIVMADARLDEAVDAIVASRVIFSGQVCNCAERVYVQKEIYDAFIEKLVAKMKASVVGDPKESGVAYSSLISAAQRDKVQGMVDRAVQAGAKVLCGGKAIERSGYFFEPTVLVNVKQDSEIMQKYVHDSACVLLLRATGQNIADSCSNQLAPSFPCYSWCRFAVACREIFGPVLPVTTFETFDEALALANDSEYGLTSSLFTENYRLIERAKTELLFGETYINRFHFEGIQGMLYKSKAWFLLRCLDFGFSSPTSLSVSLAFFQVSMPDGENLELVELMVCDFAANHDYFQRRSMFQSSSLISFHVSFARFQVYTDSWSTSIPRSSMSSRSSY